MREIGFYTRVVHKILPENPASVKNMVARSSDLKVANSTREIAASGCSYRACKFDIPILSS